MRGIMDLIADFTARQHGLIARWQARGAGIPEHVIDDLVRRGELVPVHRGVYRLRGVPYTQDLRSLAAVLAGGDGATLSLRAGWRVPWLRGEAGAPRDHRALRTRG